MLPGVATPTEAMAALAEGVDVVKLFPAGPLGGPSMVAALAGPFPRLRLVPTGGIGVDDLPAYFAAPSVLAVGGTGWRRPRWCARGASTRSPCSRPRPPRRSWRPEACGGRRGDAGFRPAEECAYDLVSLGEVMLRLDPGEERIRTARSFRVWEGGGEYNVARGLRRCFGLRTAIVTALCDNDVGRLVEDLILQGGVDPAFVHWAPFDGIGREARNGLNFTERGFGVRGAIGVSDRGHTAAAALDVGDVDWDAPLRRARRALPAHRRDLRRPLATPPPPSPRRRCAPPAGTEPSCRTT